MAASTSPREAFRSLEQAGVPAVAEHGDAVGNLEHLVEVVRDVDDRDLLLLEPMDDAEDELRFLLGERRGRLVHDEDAGLAGERAGDLDDALLGDGEALDQRVDVDRGEAELVEERAGPLAHRPVVDHREARPALHRQVGERDVLGDGHVAHHRDFLGEETDAGSDGGARIGEDDLGAVDAHRAGVAGVDAGQDLDQRRLAGAVRAEERHHLAGLDDEIDVG